MLFFMAYSKQSRKLHLDCEKDVMVNVIATVNKADFLISIHSCLKSKVKVRVFFTIILLKIYYYTTNFLPLLIGCLPMVYTDTNPYCFIKMIQ